MIVKLEFAKAFDTIEHPAMIEIMQHLRFGDHWIRCIFSSGKSSVLLNGVPGRQFHCHCGVRQCDPLSPLVFVLAADLLQSAIKDAFSRGLEELPIPTNERQDFLVIQYANDTIVLMPACTTEASRMKEILLQYVDSVDLHINFQKSTLVLINVADQLTNDISEVLGCFV